MGLQNTNFEDLIRLSDTIPVLEHLLDQKKFAFFLTQTLKDGILPELSTDEVDKVNHFLKSCPVYQLAILKKKVIKELSDNDRLLVTNYQAESYLDSLEEEIEPIINAYGQLNLIDQIREMDLYPIPLVLITTSDYHDKKVNTTIMGVQNLHNTALSKMKTYNEVEKKHYNLLYSLFSLNMDCYRIYREVSLEIENIKEKRGIVISRKVETNDCIPKDIIVSQHKPRTLESLFKDKTLYASLIEFMVTDRLLIRGKDFIEWKGHKYEIASFYEALRLEDLITANVPDSELLIIASNTFKGYSCTDRTLRSKSFPQKIYKYTEMLSRFKQI